MHEVDRFNPSPGSGPADPSPTPHRDIHPDVRVLAHDGCGEGIEP
jgi:hypothetical protein